MLKVAADILAELVVPERPVRLRHSCLRTGRLLHELAPVPGPTVTMPETSADLNQRPILLEHDVGMSHDLLVTDPKAESLREQPFPDNNLRERVARTDRGHDFRAFFWRKLVHLP